MEVTEQRFAFWAEERLVVKDKTLFLLLIQQILS